MKDSVHSDLDRHPSDGQGEKPKGLSTLRSGTILLLTAPLGAPSSLPSLRPLRYIADQIEVDSSVPVAARKHLGYGCDTPILPYSELNDYGRERRQSTLQSCWKTNTFGQRSCLTWEADCGHYFTKEQGVNCCM